MTSSVGEVSGSVDAAQDFFSCRPARDISVPPLPPLSEGAENANDSARLGEQLSNLLCQFQSVTNRASLFISGRPVEILAARPQSGRWSAAECFDHLARTTQAFLPPINDAIAAAPKLGCNRRLRVGTIANLLIHSLEPPYRLKHTALGHLAPQERHFAAAWGEFLNSQAHLSRTLHTSAGLAIDEVKIKSPVCARLTYNAYGALGILAAHQRRHLWQAEQILKSLESSAA